MMAASQSIDSNYKTGVHIDPDDVRLLAAIGFLASRHGLTALATQIFTGLRAVRPDAEFPSIGMAMSYLECGDFEKALKIILECDSKTVTQSMELRALQSLTLHLMGSYKEAAALVGTISANPEFSCANFPIAGKVIFLLKDIESLKTCHLP